MDQSELRDPYERLDGVRTRDDLAAYVVALREHLDRSPEAWENLSLKGYLEAISATLRNNAPSTFQSVAGATAGQPSWSNIANLLLSGSAYE